MKVIEHGLIGTKMKCPYCDCVIEIEKNDQLESISNKTDIPNLDFGIKCPECKINFAVLRKEWVPPAMEGAPQQRRVVKLNRVN